MAAQNLTYCQPEVQTYRKEECRFDRRDLADHLTNMVTPGCYHLLRICLGGTFGQHTPHTSQKALVIPCLQLNFNVPRNYW